MQHMIVIILLLLRDTVRSFLMFANYWNTLKKQVPLPSSKAVKRQMAAFLSVCRLWGRPHSGTALL